MSGPEQGAYDAILVVSFGGPERREDVLPFLENVTRGRGVPRERLEEVAARYDAMGGRSPINEQTSAFLRALEAELRAHGVELPVYWGNRNWHPLLADTLRAMKREGRRRALAFVTSTFASYSGCRQYLEAIEAAREGAGEGAPEVHKLRSHFNHPGFVEAMVARTREAIDALPPERRAEARLVFTAHSIPDAMAMGSHYVAELEEACALVAERCAPTTPPTPSGRPSFGLAFQSRSGPPEVPWLEPDILDHLGALAEEGDAPVVVVPIGFLSDHMEVVWDLDREAKARAAELGLTMVRAGTAGTHPAFVSAVRELVEERLGRVATRRALGTMGPAPDRCEPGCCAYTPRRSRRPPAP
jgi:ferrochelatase